MVSANRGWEPLRSAWQRALYGPCGLYRHDRPAQHFRTSVHASGLFARAIHAVVRDRGLTSVVDHGAGSGELLRQLAALDPDLRLLGVDVLPRPADLSAGIAWRNGLPDHVDGLLLANELLDNVPCDIVELDASGDLRSVEIHAGDEALRLGPPVTAPVRAWVDRWWPLQRPGERAEVGLARDEVWASACARLDGGTALAIDYGHVRDHRPPAGTLASYRAGRQTPLRLDGRHDVTAHVAMDSVAASVSGELAFQHDALRELGLTARRPPLRLATTDPAAYLRLLSHAGEVAELTASPGLGDFYWLLTGSMSTDTPGSPL